MLRNEVPEKTLVTQVCPPLVDVQISGPPTASLSPSAEDATVVAAPGAVLEYQSAPEFVLMKIWWANVAAINLDPSADEATEFQGDLGTLFEIQVLPPSGEV